METDVDRIPFVVNVMLQPRLWVAIALALASLHGTTPVQGQSDACSNGWCGTECEANAAAAESGLGWGPSLYDYYTEPVLTCNCCDGLECSIDLLVCISPSSPGSAPGGGSEVFELEPGICVLVEGTCIAQKCAGSHYFALQTCRQQPAAGYPCVDLPEGSGCQVVTLADGLEVCGIAGADPESDLTAADVNLLGTCEAFPPNSTCREILLRWYEAVGCGGCASELDATLELNQFCLEQSSNTCTGTPVPCGELGAGLPVSADSSPANAPTPEATDASAAVATDTAPTAAPLPDGAAADDAGVAAAAPLDSATRTGDVAATAATDDISADMPAAASNAMAASATSSALGLGGAVATAAATIAAMLASDRNST